MPEPEADLADFERLLREAYGTVFRVAYSVLANSADAEEVTQEAFLRAYQKFASLRDPQKFRAWVARMSWRLALNRQRAASRALRRDTAWLAAQPAANNPAPEAAGRELELRLRGEMARLPEKLRAVLQLSAIEGLDTRAVAAILEIPEGTVRSRLHLARRQLWKVLRP
jgi:RNA polymerase sigma-70 factor (ECF subfamily)